MEACKRERIVAAIAEVTHRDGLHGLTVAAIMGQAKMGRATFYELFATREEAVRSAVDLGNDRLRAAIDLAAGGGGSAQERVARVIERMVGVVEIDPHLAELSLVHAKEAGGAQMPFDVRLVETLAGVLRALRRSTPKPGPPPRTEELLAHAILAVISERLRQGEVDALPALGGELAEIATRPFLASRGSG